jgi:hypothetical protein
MHEIMGFIWPMMAASAEGMMWFWIVVVLIIIGRGKILPSEKPIIIDRKGQYKMELAPGLNLVQPFIEAIAKQLFLHEDTKQNNLEILFRVRDKNIASRKRPFYLLGISLQNGYLFFEARHDPEEQIHPNTTSFESGNKWTVMKDVESAIHTTAKLWAIDLYRVK